MDSYRVIEWVKDHGWLTLIVAVATVIGAFFTVLIFFTNNEQPVVVMQGEQQVNNDAAPALTAIIESHKYRHAQPTFEGLQEEWQERWVEALDDYLK